MRFFKYYRLKTSQLNINDSGIIVNVYNVMLCVKKEIFNITIKTAFIKYHSRLCSRLCQNSMLVLLSSLKRFVQK